ncbi:MAG: SGNH/GDSL hydrolase family protein, partial [Bryobacteraceae bacterium]
MPLISTSECKRHLKRHLMSSNNTSNNGTLLRRSIAAGAAALALAMFAPASAEVPIARPAATAAAPAPSIVAPSVPAVGAKSATSPSAALSPPGPAFSCNAPAEFAHLAYPLRHAARRLASGEPLTIVAIGSSSTAGAGASSPAASYPSRLAVELKQRFPGHDIVVLNRGVNGEETQDMMARFSTGVIAVHPDLVLWQVGTNSVLRDYPLASHSALLHQGIAQLKEAGADVVLIDMQFAPRVLAKVETQGMEDQIAVTAKEESVDLFRRFAVMRNWHEVQHIPFDVFVASDELHMNDWSYGCVAKLLAAGIAEAATRPG